MTTCTWQVGADKEGHVATWRHITYKRGGEARQFASDIWLVVGRRAEVGERGRRSVSLRRQHCVWCRLWDHVRWLPSVAGQETSSHRYVACCLCRSYCVAGMWRSSDLNLTTFEFVASLYSHMLTSFGHIMIFNKVAYIFLEVLIIFTGSSFEFRQVRLPWLHR